MVGLAVVVPFEYLLLVGLAVERVDTVHDGS